MSTRRTKVSLPVSPRAPKDEKGLLSWAQKELHQFFIQVRDVINNLRDYVDTLETDTYKVKVDSAGTADYLEGKLDDSATVEWTKVGDKMQATAIATAPPGQYDFIPFWEGTLNSNKAVWGVRVDRACSLPAGLTGSYATATTAALAECILTIKKNGTSVGTITWVASGTVATLAAASTITLAAGDLLQIWTPAVADAQLAGITISLKGGQV